MARATCCVVSAMRTLKRDLLTAVSLFAVATTVAALKAGQVLIPAQPDLSALSTYNVMGYGAKGDGTSDDTAAIASAITVGGSVFDGSSTARVIYFPVGTYRIT